MAVVVTVVEPFVDDVDDGAVVGGRVLLDGGADVRVGAVVRGGAAVVVLREGVDDEESVMVDGAAEAVAGVVAVLGEAVVVVREAGDV